MANSSTLRVKQPRAKLSSHKRLTYMTCTPIITNKYTNIYQQNHGSKVYRAQKASFALLQIDMEACHCERGVHDNKVVKHNLNCPSGRCQLTGTYQFVREVHATRLQAQEFAALLHPAACSSNGWCPLSQRNESILLMDPPKEGLLLVSLQTA